MPAKDLVINIGVQLSKNITQNLNRLKKNIRGVFQEAEHVAKGSHREFSALERDLAALSKIQLFRDAKKNTEQARAAWKQAEKQVAELARQIKASDKTTKSLSKAFEQAKKKAADLKKEFARQQRSLHSVRSELKSAGVDVRNLAREEARLKAARAASEREAMKAAKLEAARAALGVKSSKQIQREIRALKAAYEHLKSSGVLTAKELYAAQGRLKRQIAALKQEANGWSSYLSEARAGIIALAGSIYALRDVFGTFGEFTQRMAEVNTLLNVSQKRFEGLSKEIIAMSKDIPQSANELAAAEYDIISAGVALENSTKVLELSAKAAVAGVTDTKTAVNAGLAVINAYGLGIGRLSEVYDTLFQTVKLGVTTFPELSENIGQVLPTARAASVNFKEVAASIAIMTKAGIRTPIATTALRGAINALASPTAEAQKEFDRLGVTWEGLIPTLEQLRQRGLSIEQWRRLIPDVRARTGVIALVQNLEALRDVLGQMGDASGAMLEAFDKMKDTPENQIKLFKNEVKALMISFGGFLAKAILPLLKGFRLFVENLSKADIVTKGLVAVITGSIAVYSLWAVGLGKLVFALKGLVLSAHEASGALALLGQELTALNASGYIGITVAVVYSGYQLSKLIKEVYELRKITKENRQEAEKDTEVAKQYAYAKDLQIKSAAELAQMTAEEREQYKKNLVAAMNYYSHLETAAIRMSTDAMLGGLLPFQSAKGKENEKRAKELAKKTSEYMRALREVARAGREASQQTASLSLPQIGKGVDQEIAKISKRNEALNKEIQIIKQAHELKVKEINLTLQGVEQENALLQERNRYYEELKNKILQSYSQSIEGLNRYEDALIKVASTEKESGNKIIEIQRKILAAKKEAAEKAKQALLSALSQALAKEQEYANRVKSLTREIKEYQLSFEQELRDLRRSQMSQEEALADKRIEAQEAVSKARAAMEKKDYESAKEFARRAKSLYTDIARAGKDSFQEGYAGVKEAGQLYLDILSQQKEEAEAKWKAQQEATKDLTDAIKKLDEVMKEVNDQIKSLPPEKKSKIVFTQKGLDKIKRDYEALKDKEITITIKEKHVETHATGGLAGWKQLLSGGHLPGFGGGDRVRTLLEPGEYVHPLKSVSYYGVGFHELLRKMAIPREVLWSAVSGWKRDRIHRYINNVRMSVASVPLRFEQGGYVPNITTPDTPKQIVTKVVDVNFNFGDRSFRLSGSQDVVRELTDYLRKERLMRI